MSNSEQMPGEPALPYIGVFDALMARRPEEQFDALRAMSLSYAAEPPQDQRHAVGVLGLEGIYPIPYTRPEAESLTSVIASHDILIAAGYRASGMLRDYMISSTVFPVTTEMAFFLPRPKLMYHGTLAAFIAHKTLTYKHCTSEVAPTEDQKQHLRIVRTMPARMERWPA